MNRFLQGFLIGVAGVFGMVVLGYIIINGMNFLFAVLGDMWGAITSMAITVGLILGTALQSRE